MIRKTKIFWRFILLTLINSLLSVILQHFFCKISLSIVKRNSTMSTLYISLTCIMRYWYPKQFKGKHCLSQPLYLLILIRYYSQHLYILSISTNLTKPHGSIITLLLAKRWQTWRQGPLPPSDQSENSTESWAPMRGRDLSGVSPV